MDNNVHILNLATYEKPQVVESTNKEWVSYGLRNDYYDWLIGRYKNSTTNNAVINNIAKLIYGRGLHALDASRKPNEYAMMKTMFTPKALRGIALNFKMLGAGYFQVIYNKQHTKIVKVDYIPTRLIRVGKCNADGEIDSYFYSDNWEDLKRNPPVRYSAYGTSKDGIEIDCVKFESIDMKYYTDVDYLGGIPYAVLEEEIADFQINDVQNGFSSTKLINFSNGVPSEEAQREISRQVKGQLTGAKGDKIIVSFNDNAESKATIEDISLSDAPDHYTWLSNECQSKILNAHTVISPMIVGVTTENSGFSSNADEIEMATKVFYNQSIVAFQDAMLEKIDEYLAFNGASLDLYFRRLNLMDSIEEKQQIKEETELKLSNQMDEIISKYGEEESDEWVLIDEREVDYDLEEDLDNQVKDWEAELQKEDKTKLSKLWKFVSSGMAFPNAKSSQDKEVDGFFFKTRYKYTGSSTGDSREFCNTMMGFNKVYRKEDIERMGADVVNAGFGEFGSDRYSIWLYKGGARCRHRWVRMTYVSATRSIDVKSPLANTKPKGGNITKTKASKFGYKINNDKKVATIPNNMPLKGFSPNNKNLPKDV
mgnify:FL=1